MSNPSLYLSRDTEYDYLRALEFGRVPEDQPPRCWMPIHEDFAFWRRERGRRPRGFIVNSFSTFDENDPGLERDLWKGPRFAVPLLGLTHASAGEIIVAARAHFGDEASINRMYFDMATGLQGEQALAAWRCCLEAGDSMAHFALGYTLYELERYHEGYAHLRLYTELAPHAAWNWCWFGKAALAIGETQEARSALKRAVELTAEGDHETDAPELLAALRGR